MRGSTYGLGDVLDHPDDWRLRAACRTVGDDTFFPVGSVDSKTVRAQAVEAGRYCRGCTVRTECTAARQGASGVWGGVLYDDRGRPVLDVSGDYVPLSTYAATVGITPNALQRWCQQGLVDCHRDPRGNWLINRQATKPARRREEVPAC